MDYIWQTTDATAQMAWRPPQTALAIIQRADAVVTAADAATVRERAHKILKADADATVTATDAGAIADAAVPAATRRPRQSAQAKTARKRRL